LYDDDRTFDTMLIVLTNRVEGKQMTDHEQTQISPAVADASQDKGSRGPTASQVAAAVEAAYILEAVRR
jgi:hypothetical protein